MRVIAHILGASTMVLLLALTDTVPAQTPAGTLRYTIMRNGDPIGTHAIEISRSGPETNVRVTTDLTVKVLFVTAYRLQHNASEKWVNGQLVAFSSSTDDNGTRHKVTATMGAAGLEIDADGKTSRVDKTMMPGSLWNPELMRRKAVLDPQDGQIDPLAVVDSGTEELSFDGRAVKAHRYQMKGRYSQEVWYDERGRLVQVKLLGSDGSVISYRPM